MSFPSAGGPDQPTHPRQPLPTLAQGPTWIVVAKPPGLLVHRNPRMRTEYAALQRVRDAVGKRVYPIHRIDRPASGCLLFATERTSAGPLHASLCAANSRKTYLAFVRGAFPHETEVLIETPMKDDNGFLKDAASRVRCIGRSHEPRCSLLVVEPLTGRYHQVRRHVRDLHHPVIHDGDHGDSRINRWWRENFGVTRLGLHAFRLSMTLPNGEPLLVTCPLFVDQAKIWRDLPWWEEAVAQEPDLLLPPLPLLDQTETTIEAEN